MPARDWKFRIEDIIGNIQEVLELTQGMDFTTFSEDNRTAQKQCSLIWQSSGKLPDARYP